MNWIKTLSEWFGRLHRDYKSSLSVYSNAETQREIYEYNRFRFLSYCGLLIVGFFLLAVVSNLFDTISMNTTRYAVETSALLLVCCVGAELTKHHPEYSTFFAYVFIIEVLLFTAYLGTYYDPDGAGTAFCVAIVVMPMLFMLRPSVLIAVSGIASVCFCICCAMVKSRNIANLDIINVVFYYFISIPINIGYQMNRNENLLRRNFIMHERDTDKLTGLLTKNAFELQVRHHLKTTPDKGCMVFADLDNFKRVNDIYGHLEGDRVIEEVGRGMQNSFRASDIKGHFGGDEFTVFLTDVSDLSVIEGCAERWKNAIGGILLPNPDDILTGSIGIAVISGGSCDYETLLKTADEALYEAKKTKGTEKFFCRKTV